MERLACAIKRAAEIREKSYDREAVKREAFPYSCDYNKFYKVSLWDACDQAAEEVGFDGTGTMPIYLMLINSWNDALEWANKTLRR